MLLVQENFRRYEQVAFLGNWELANKLVSNNTDIGREQLYTELVAAMPHNKRQLATPVTSTRGAIFGFLVGKWAKDSPSTKQQGRQSQSTQVSYYRRSLGTERQTAIDNVDSVVKALQFLTNIEDFTADILQLESIKAQHPDITRFHQEFYNPLRKVLRVTGKFRLGLLSNRQLHDALSNTMIKA